MTDRTQTQTSHAEGTRIYNRGDMANHPHWGTITRSYTDRWGSHVTITIDEDDDTIDEVSYTVPAMMISDIDKGNGLTRIVTEEAYNTWRTAQIEKLTLNRRLA